LPPLRERKEDIPVLAQYFVQKYVEKFKKPIKYIVPEAMALLLSYSWPGNVRELQNVIEYACTFAMPPKILPENFPETIRGDVNTLVSLQSDEPLSLAEMEKRYILQVLKSTNWHQKRACDILKISKATLYRRLKEYGISPKKLKNGMGSK
jgi:DNA-binding NtrC family response regulator